MEEDVVVCPLRRVSSAVERGILLPGGTVLGMDEDGRDGWLVRYMTLPGPLVAARR